MKCFLQLFILGLLALLVIATPVSRTRRQTSEDQLRALNNLFVRNQRQTQVNFGFPQQFPSSTTATPSAGRTTSSPQFLRCLQGCVTVNQYNPVCGTDGENYHNEYKLNCAKTCGKSVEMVRAGTCQPL